MNQNYPTILFIDTSKITKKMFAKKLETLSPKNVTEILKFSPYENQKKHLASKVLKSNKLGKHWNTSHSGQYSCIVYSHKKIGIDIQKHTGCKNWRKISERDFFDDNIRNKKDFFKNWTIKESAIKCWKLNKDINFSKIKINDDTVAVNKSVLHYKHIFLWKNYSCTICSPQKFFDVNFKEISVS